MLPLVLGIFASACTAAAHGDFECQSIDSEGDAVTLLQTEQFVHRRSTRPKHAFVQSMRSHEEDALALRKLLAEAEKQRLTLMQELQIVLRQRNAAKIQAEKSAMSLPAMKDENWQEAISQRRVPTIQTTVDQAETPSTAAPASEIDEECPDDVLTFHCKVSSTVGIIIWSMFSVCLLCCCCCCMFALSPDTVPLQEEAIDHHHDVIA
jgi:hypothetical protein